MKRLTRLGSVDVTDIGLLEQSVELRCDQTSVPVFRSRRTSNTYSELVLLRRLDRAILGESTDLFNGNLESSVDAEDETRHLSWLSALPPGDRHRDVRHCEAFDSYSSRRVVGRGEFVEQTISIQDEVTAGCTNVNIDELQRGMRAGLPACRVCY
jgi:hypothetical protein